MAGYCTAVDTMNGAGGVILPKAVLAGGEVAYRARLRFKVTNAVDCHIGMALAGILDDGSVSGWFLNPATESEKLNGNTDIIELNVTYSAFAVPGAVHFSGFATRPYLRPYVRVREGAADIELHSFSVVDCTNELKSLISAQAAVGSASSAATSASDASTSASAAQTAKIEAETARGQAQTSATNAATSETNAAGSASTAASQAGLAATARGQAEGYATAAQTSANTASASATTAGEAANTASSHASTAQTQAGIATVKAGEAASSASAANTSAVEASSYSQLAALALSNGMAANPTFLDWTGTYPAQMSVTLGSNGSVHKDPGKYGNAIRIVTTAGGVGPYVTLTNNDALSQLNGSRNPDKVMVSLEAACSGNLNGFTVDAGWYDGSTWYNSGQLIGTKLKAGAGVQSYQFTLSRPAGAEGKNITAFRLRFLPSHNQYGASFSACTVRLHRIDCSEVVADSFVDQQISTKATVDGIASAGYIMRVKAGGANAGFEMVAANNPTGPASSIRMNADEIILNGSVKAPHIGAGAVGAEQIQANSIAGRHMIVADLVNLVPDSDFVDAPSWNRDESPGWIFQIAGPVFSGINWAIAPATQRGSVWSQQFSVEQGSEYYFSIEARREGAGGDASLGARINWLNGTGESIGFTPNIVGTLTGSYQKFSDSFVAPANAKRARIHFFCNNGSVGSVCVGAPTVRLKYGGKLIVDGDIEGRHIKSDSLEAGLLNTTSMSNAGLAVFGGTLQSDNFNIGNNTGWRIQQNGTANFNNLIVRNSLQVGAVSDIVQNYSPGEGRWADGTTRVITLGAMEPTHVWGVNISLITRGTYGYYRTQSGQGSEVSYTYNYYWAATRYWFEREVQIENNWQGWVILSTDLAGGSGGAWSRWYYSESFGGEFTNVRYRIRFETQPGPNVQAWPDPDGQTFNQTNVKKPTLVARQVMR
ncbi:hypothetical protein MR829_12620 [Paracoccus versutus]|uniref:hypothetical protein n=1 Tax=Paracoccus versutus TaxID=34007 RepID=UPI001FB70FFF|nr:hypothetical protein [Paracoccus versutus]MCJ1901217.1 hypothetical protein [Paracoccus versutus]